MSPTAPTHRKLSRTPLCQVATSHLNSLRLRDTWALVCAKDINFHAIDIETGKPAWKAKNLPRDELNLVEKIYHVDCLPRGPSEVYVVSGFNKILLYDTRAQKKAISEHSIPMEEEALLTAICQADPDLLAVGNSHGSIGLLDSRKGLQLTRTLTDHMSGITHLYSSSGQGEFQSGKLISITRSGPPRVDLRRR